VSDNGELPQRTKREPKVTPKNTPPWLVSYAEAKKAEHYMATKFTPATRKMYGKLAGEALEHSGSIRLILAGRKRRQLMADCFVEVVEDGGDKELYRQKLQNVGMSPMLIMLLLEIAFKVLMYFWQNKGDV
jgi:hypothetical protein